MRPVALLGCALLGACTPQYDACFAPDSEVSALQVLAVRTDPPEVVLGSDGSVPSVSVQALVVDPSALINTSFELSSNACAPTDDRSCAGAGQPRVTGPPGPMTFDFAATPALVASALEADPLRGYGGIRVQLALEVTGNRQSTKAEKLLLYSPAGTEPNHALEIAGLRVRRFSFLFHEDKNVPLPPADQVLLPGQPLLVDVGDPVWLEPLLAPGPGATEAQETYTVTDFSGNTVTLREQVSYSFYTTAHVDLSPAQASAPDPAVGPPAQGLTRYRYLKVRGGDATLWIVARDSRGAQAWLAVPVHATDLRACVEQVPPNCPLLEFGCL
jgi:hypothetical protein